MDNLRYWGIFINFFKLKFYTDLFPFPVLFIYLFIYELPPNHNPFFIEMKHDCIAGGLFTSLSMVIDISCNVETSR